MVWILPAERSEDADPCPGYPASKQSQTTKSDPAAVGPPEAGGFARRVAGKVLWRARARLTGA